MLKGNLREFISASMKFKVGISKVYFPKDKWFKGEIGDLLEVVTVMAGNRTEAAQKAWEEHGAGWLRDMNPKQTKTQRVSLYVNDPKAPGNSGLIQAGSDRSL